MKLSNKNCWNLCAKVSACIGPIVIRASVKMAGPMGIGSSNICFVFIVKRRQRKDVSSNSVLTRNGNVATERNNGNGTTERHNGNGQRQRNGGKQA